jgi:hypothetical protein
VKAGPVSWLTVKDALSGGITGATSSLVMVTVAVALAVN